MPINFNGVGIFEKDGQKVGLRPIEISTHYGENPILRAEVLHHLDRLDALRYATGGVIPRKREDLIKDVIFNDPATIVLWKDGTKTVVKCQEGDTYSKELGLAMCISKKYLGNKGNFNEVFKKWIPDETPYTEEELSQLLQNIDFSKIGEALGDILYNFGKSLIEIYGPKPENTKPEEDLDIDPIEPEGDIADEAIKDSLHYYCNRTPCLVCGIPKDENGDCKLIDNMEHEELINTYKTIKKENK